MRSPVDLSILICSTHTRWDTFGLAIQHQLWDQHAALTPEQQARVEVLILTDNKRMMLGEKRNVMVDAAQGRYIVFVDDDDRIESDYMTTLLEATSSDADVIVFHASVSIDGAPPKLCRYSKDYAADENTRTEYLRIPNHICCVKRDLALTVSFPNVLYGEDAGYSKLLHPLLKTEHRIDRVLYHYDFNSGTTETQQHLNGRARRRQRPPLADVVVLSNATSPQLAQMTQDAVTSCIAGANSLPVNVMVLEQSGHTYRDADTIRMTTEFNYNRFANVGARWGSAQWIVIANNDVVFHDGWLHHLLAARHPVVSPKNPGDSRQAEIEVNTLGDRTGKHFSGWCFMISRELWERIGGFDEDFAFWCADDAVIEQVKAVGVTPMLVPASQVAHLGSVTLRQTDDRDELTWAQIARFNEKYGRHRLSEHPAFQEWELTHTG